MRYNGIEWILERDNGRSQVYRHPTDPLRRLSVIDPTYTFNPTADNWIDEYNANNNYGTGAVIHAGGGYTGKGCRAILKFDLTSQIAAGVTINSAILSLDYFGYDQYDPVGRTFWVYRLTQTGWTELGSTWNKYDGTHAWASAGGDYTTTDGASAVMPASYGWVAWTVTAQVQTAVDSVGRIAHFLVKDDVETGSQVRAADFYSKDAGGSAYWPKLYVDWSVPVTQISASDSGAGSESVSASISLSVPDSGVGNESGISIGPLGTDVGVGVEAVATSAEMTVTDAGAGAESPTVDASLSSSDLGVGTDAPLIQNQLTETDVAVGSDSAEMAASVTVVDSGAGVETPSMLASIPVSDSAVGSESTISSTTLTVADSGLGLENVTTPGTLTVIDEGKGAEFAWRIKPSSPMIDALALPHVLSMRISDPATMSDKKVQGGALPRRTMVGKSGRTVEIDGWSDSQTDIDALEALRDGVRRTFYHPSGDSFGVLVTGFEPSRTVDQYNRRTYRLALAEAN